MRVGVFSGAGNRIYLLHGQYSAEVERGTWYGAFVGTSSGAILALAYSSLGDRPISVVRDLLGSIRQISDVATGGGWWDKLRTVLGHRAGFHDPSPLLGLLRSFWQTTSTPARAIAVDLHSGNAAAFGSLDAGFPTAVLASSSVAPFFPPVRFASGEYVDGGVRDFAPIGHALDLGASEIDVFVSKPLPTFPQPGPFTGISATLRELDLLQHEVLVGDLERAHLRNALVEAGRPHRPGDRFIKVRVCAPTPGLWRQMPKLSSYLEFTPDTYPAMESIGRRSWWYSLPEAIAMARKT